MLKHSPGSDISSSCLSCNLLLIVARSVFNDFVCFVRARKAKQTNLSIILKYENYYKNAVFYSKVVQPCID